MAAVPLPLEVAAALRTWLDVHDEVAPGVIEGLYVVGSAALGDWTPHSDIDVVAVVADPSDPDLYQWLADSQAGLSTAFERPVDGPYVAWGDLVVPAMAVQRPWVLDGEYHVDGESFEINPVTWYTLATYGIAFRGPEPSTIGVISELDERRAWVRGNVDTYWRGVGERLAAALAGRPTAEVDGDVLEWTALGIARMLYTYETGDVLSKRAAGQWAAERLPADAELFELAVAVRSNPQPVALDVALRAAALTIEIADAISR
ncbi:MAG: aminoglycoside adenylyltransferase domain-containing protein [Actinomycetota bacterium]